MKDKSVDHYLTDVVDFIQVSYKIKASISPPLHYPSLSRSILGIKAYLLIIGP